MNISLANKKGMPLSDRAAKSILRCNVIVESISAVLNLVARELELYFLPAVRRTHSLRRLLMALIWHIF